LFQPLVGRHPVRRLSLRTAIATGRKRAGEAEREEYSSDRHGFN
jgi:hypothetical protein